MDFLEEGCFFVGKLFLIKDKTCDNKYKSKTKYS